MAPISFPSFTQKKFSVVFSENKLEGRVPNEYGKRVKQPSDEVKRWQIK